MDDDDLDRALDAIRRRRKAKAWEDSELARMESTLSQTTPPAFYRDVPPPGFCHPYHENAKRFIIGWLDGKSGIGGYDLMLPVIPPRKFRLNEPDSPVAMPDIGVIAVRRQKAFAIAPYVGRPFVYWWFVGVDDHGRGVGGEKTTLVHTDGFGDWLTRPYVTGVHRADVKFGLPGTTPGPCRRCGQHAGHEVHGWRGTGEVDRG